MVLLFEFDCQVIEIVFLIRSHMYMCNLERFDNINVFSRLLKPVFFHPDVLILNLNAQLMCLCEKKSNKQLALTLLHNLTKK